MVKNIEIQGMPNAESVSVPSGKVDQSAISKTADDIANIMNQIESLVSVS